MGETGTSGIDARIAKAVQHHRDGRIADAEAGYRAILTARPDYAPVRHNLGVLLAEAGRAAEAIAQFDRVIATDPGYAAAHFNRANALRLTGDAATAIDGYRRTVALEPDHYAAHRALAFLWLSTGRRDRALDHFARTMELRRGEDRTGIADDSLTCATRAKLRHDAEQFRYIATLGRNSARYEMLSRTYQTAARGIGDSVGDHEAVALTRMQSDLLGDSYNTPFHVIDAPERPSGAVNASLDRDAITAAFRAQAPGIAWVDDLLTQDALARLRRFLLESTIWFDFSHIGGFLASYLEDGLACPLMLQIADEVRTAFPGIVGDRPLSQGWAFKGVAGDLPIDLHADDAAVSLNFWVTPDAANRDITRSGLVLYRTVPPADWKIADYDQDRSRIAAFVADHEADRVVVPYRENRAVLFDSRLFHGSDSPDFLPGYENHRINITLLYG